MRVFQVINSVFTSNSCTWEKNELKIYLIDIGDVDPVLDYLTDISMAKVEGVFTHIHYDYIYVLSFIGTLSGVFGLYLFFGKKH